VTLWLLLELDVCTGAPEFRSGDGGWAVGTGKYIAYKFPEQGVLENLKHRCTYLFNLLLQA